MAPVEATKSAEGTAVKAARGKRTESPAPRSPKAAEEKEVEKPQKVDASTKPSADATTATEKQGRSFVGYLKKATLLAVVVVGAVCLAMQLRLDAGFDVSAARQEVAAMFTPMRLKVGLAGTGIALLLVGIYCIRGLLMSYAKKATACCRRNPFRKGTAPATAAADLKAKAA
mmetsp:Transcript_73221/g.136829  ORF Transcript_73221/g.136829 Transcript_73221/m.136829 type:complete len:172 (+) Transcript_73221:80-595(+)